MERLNNFDTHSAVKRLVTAGLKDKVAEEIVQSMVLSRDYDLSKFVTKDEFFKAQQKNSERFNSIDKELALIKQEIGTLRKEFKSGNEALRKDILAEISKSKAETIKWLVGLFVGSAIAYFIKHHF